MLAAAATFALEGIDSREVTVEVDVRRGLPAFTVVGLPDAAVREARERVRAAILNSGLEFPMKRLTANLAPASVRKAGPSFDLALAVAVLVASGQLAPERLAGCAVCGELSLSGELRAVHGALAVALGARAAGYRKLLVPAGNAPEAALVEGLEVLGVPDLGRIVAALDGRWEPPAPGRQADGSEPAVAAADLAEVRGQPDAKRALEIAAAGGHNLLMVGPPGAGKTMLARRLPGILPPPDFEEALEITRVHSVAGLGDGRLARRRPFRGPHHTISPAGLAGGGDRPRPGEITLAHRGVLFLDELAEFSRPALEALRQPLEDGHVQVNRGLRSLTFPAVVMLVGACNPCACGRGASDCSCDEVAQARYRRRLSGPLIDRIDIVCQVELPAGRAIVSRDEPPPAERSAAVRARVMGAPGRQRRRLGGTGARCNADMGPAATRRWTWLDAPAAARMLAAAESGSLGGRGHDRVLRVARTIADLDGRDRLSAEDLDEALGYRLDPLELAAA